MPPGPGFEIWPGDPLQPGNFIYVCVPVPDTRTHRLAFASQINDLARWHLWQRDEDESGRKIALSWSHTVKTVHEQLDQRHDECSDPGAVRCYDFSPSWSELTWYPRSPYEAYEQPGLPVPVWMIADLSLPPFVSDVLNTINDFLGFDADAAIEELTGLRYGDVLTTLFNILSLDIDPNNLPGFSFKVQGTGKIQIEFLNILAGGRVSVSVDQDPWGDVIGLDSWDNFLQQINDFIDPNDTLLELNRDIISLPPETDTTAIEEIQITEPGEHEIFVRFIPTLNDAADFVNFGGGLRKITLCGFDSLEDRHMTATEEAVYNGNLRLLQQLCGCIGGDSDGGNSGDAVGSGDPGTIGGGLTGTAETASEAFGEVHGFIAGFNDAILDMDAVYANLYVAGVTASELSSQRLEFQQYVKAVYDVNGEPQDPAAGDPETGALYLFARHVWNNGGVLGGFAGGLAAWRDAVACRKLTLRGTLAQEAYQVLTGDNRESFLLMLDMFTDDQFSQWAFNGVPNDNWTALSCAPQFIEDLILDTSGSRQKTSTPDWRARDEPTLVRVTFSGQLTSTEGGTFDGLYYTKPDGTRVYKPLWIGTYTSGYNGQWRRWSWTKPNPGVTQITAEAPTGDNQFELDNSPVTVQNREALNGGVLEGASGSITIKFEDLGEV